MSLEDTSYTDCRISGDRSTCSSPELTCNLLPASTGVPNLGSILLSPSPLPDHPHSEDPTYTLASLPTARFWARTQKLTKDAAVVPPFQFFPASCCWTFSSFCPPSS
nr:unnamed protein product [Spirometra erinaceieuropaei]